MNTSVLNKVFSVNHLLGYIFVTTSPLKISDAYRKASLPNSRLPLPIPMQRDEWCSSLDALPWLNHYISPRSWVIINNHQDKSQIGKLGYVLRSCLETQHSIVAIIPNPPCINMKQDPKQSGATEHKHGKAAHEGAFQNKVALAKSRFLASEEEDRIAVATIRIEHQRSEIKRSSRTSEERQKQLADLKVVKEKEMVWSILESRNPWPQKAGTLHLWKLEDHYATQKVFRVRHPSMTSFSKAFSKKFRLPKISCHANTELEVKVVKMDTKTFDWVFMPMDNYIVYEYLG